MSAVRASTHIDRGRIRELTERESKRLDEQTQGSKRMYERARGVLPGGVPSSYQLREPWPIYLERGEGASVWDPRRIPTRRSTRTSACSARWPAT